MQDVVDATNEGSYRVRHPHTRRDLTKIRLAAARAIAGHKQAVKALEEIVSLAGADDARELKRRPSLRAKSGKKAKKGARPR